MGVTHIRKLVHGHDINDSNTPVSTTPVYLKWQDMLKRCYSAKWLAKCPTYLGCSVSEEWLTFSNFAKWYKANHIEGYDLDKDLRVQGNKVYSADTCLFIPQAINNLILVRVADIGAYPVGVSLNKASGKYQASIKIDGKSKYLGIYTTPEIAQQVYNQAKNTEIAKQISKHPELSEYLKRYLLPVIS